MLTPRTDSDWRGSCFAKSHMRKFVLALILLIVQVLFEPGAQAALFPFFPEKNLPKNTFQISLEPQEIQYIHSGIASLAKRLQMIESAKKTIDVEFYIYSTDQAGRLFTQALIKKAKSGVKVRLLVDSAPFVRSLNQYYATVLAQYGIEVRFYNQSLMLDLQKVMHRSHRKAMIVDSEQAITGGRNMSDEYFDLSEKYNFLDRDVYLRGSLVGAVQDSFNEFWGTKVSKIVESAIEPKIEDYGFQDEREAKSNQHYSEVDRQAYRRFKSDISVYRSGMIKANQFIFSTQADFDLLDRVQREGQSILNQTYKGICNESYFIADYPGWKKDSRVLYTMLANFINAAQEKVLVETPYFILTDKDNLFTQVLSRGVKLEVLTNSLFSSDNSLAIATFYPRVSSLINQGASVFIYDGTPPLAYGFPKQRESGSRWGIHSKSAVIDEDTSMISTFNIDPRSKDLNAEMAIICRGNKELAQSLKDDMELRKKQMVQLDSNGQPVDGRSLYFGTTPGKQLIYHLGAPFANIIDFLL